MKNRITYLTLVFLLGSLEVSCQSSNNVFISESKSSILHTFSIIDSSTSCFHFQFSEIKNINGRLSGVKDLNEAQKLNLINNLLRFEGDKRLCCSFSEDRRQYVDRIKLTSYTLEIEALLLINQLFFEDPFNYSPSPRIQMNGDSESINNDITVQIAFQQYKQWFIKMEEIGFEKAKEIKLLPLDGSIIHWL